MIDACFKCSADMTNFHGLICGPCRESEKEERRRSSLTKAERAYEDEFGVEAAERQRELAKQFFTCCGEHREGPHHVDCAKFVAVEVPQVHADQGSLC